MEQPIQVPDASADPAAYVRALLELLGDRDPLEVLRKTAEEVEAIVAHHGATALHARASLREWSFCDVLGHLLDVDIVYGFRVRLTLTESEPAYPGYDEKGFSRLPKMDVVGLATAFRSLRNANLELFQRLTREQWERRGIHGEQGSEDVRLMVRKLAGHDIAHLNQMRRAVETAREPLSIDSAENLLRRAERAFAAQDLGEICSLFTDDVVARYAGMSPIHGKQRLREYLEQRLRAQKGYRPVKTLVAASGNLLVDSWEGDWTDADSGTPMAGRGIEILQIEKGLVSELDAVFLTWPTSKGRSTPTP